MPILKELHKVYGVDLLFSPPVCRTQKSKTDPPVAAAAKLLGIELYQPETMTSEEALERVSDINPT